MQVNPHARKLLTQLHRCEVFIRSLRHEKLESELQSMIEYVNMMRHDIASHYLGLGKDKTK